MSEIIIENVVKKFGSFTALDNVSLSIQEHEFVVLLGPSGCGKTTLLRAIAGLGMADSGRIIIAGRDVTYLPPRDRRISMVFQNYAIFPHMTVYDNIAFGLKMKKKSTAEIQERVQTTAKLLHIETMLGRYPSQMSGGQRQRIAVARAIAVDTDVLLMDEPLSNLDALLRLEMRAELKSLLNRLGVTTVYVTHDQIEAMSMGDRIAVMQSGRILQYDRPTHIYDMPIERFVGSFIGNPPMNFLEGHAYLVNGQIKVRIADWLLEPAPTMGEALRRYQDKSVLVGIRAEWMEVFSQPTEGALEVTVEVVEPLGSQNLLTVHIGDNMIKVSTHPHFLVNTKDKIWLRFPHEKIRWIDSETEQAITLELEQAMA
jgi:multiple sugar transport system ATP-binding protein